MMNVVGVDQGMVFRRFCDTCDNGLSMTMVSYAGGGSSGGVLWHGQWQQHVQLWPLADRATGEDWGRAAESASITGSRVTGAIVILLRPLS